MLNVEFDPKFIYDCVVVGAGPAGTAAAIAAKKSTRATVAIIDKEPLGRDKICGDGFGPDTKSLLNDIRCGEVLHVSEKVDAFTIADTDGNTVSGKPPTPGYMIPRHIFDARMLTSAMDRGVAFTQGTITNLTQTPTLATLTLTDGTTVRARTVIGADGAHSTVRSLVGAPPNDPTTTAVAIRAYLDNTTNISTPQIVWDAHDTYLDYAWVFPNSAGKLNVGYSTTKEASQKGTGTLTGVPYLTSRARHILAHIPGITHATFTSHELPLSTFRPAPAWGNVLLTGDAASLINPLSGEGISHAILSGTLAGNSIGTATRPGTLYTKNLKTATGKHHTQVLRVTHFAEKSPHLISAAIKTSRNHPHMFNAFLRIALGNGHLNTFDMARLLTTWGRT